MTAPAATAQALGQAVLEALAPHGFRPVAPRGGELPDVVLLAKRQTWNTNRAVVVAELAAAPEGLRQYLDRLRRDVAFACRFVPFFWGIGVQAVIVAPGILDRGVRPESLVASVDNQWAIVQSVFLVDPVTRRHASARSWGQLITGRFQDAIEAAIRAALPQ